MTLSPLLLKSLFGCVSVAGVGTAASFQIYQAYGDKPTAPGNISEPGDTDKPSESATPPKTSTPLTLLTPAKVILPFTTNPVVLVKAKSDLTSTSQISVDSTNHEYKCKVSDDDSNADFCNLVKLNFVNNWIDVNGIKKATSPTTPLLKDLNAEDHHFKLEINQALYEKAKLSEKKHIEIISTTTPNKTLAKLNVSFKVSGSDIDYVSTNYALGKYASTSGSYESSKNYECPFSNASPVTSSATHACAIYPFGSTIGTLNGAGYHKQTPADLLTTTATSPLAQNQYYILNYTTPITKTDLTTNKSAHINKVENSTAENVGNFKNLAPAITQGTTNKKLFILSDTPSYSIIVKKHTQLALGKTITHTSSTKNYQCKYDTSTAFDCELVELDLSDTKTSMNVVNIKNTDLTTDLSVPESEAKTQYFKLDVPLAQFETIKTALTATSPTTVKVVEITDGSAKIGDLTPIFAIDDNNLVYFHKSSYVVSSATPVTDSATFTDGKKKYCAFVESDSSALSDAKECEVKDLGTSIDANTDFTSTKDAAAITAENTYLVTFVETSGVTAPTAQDIQDKLLLVLQGTSDEDSSKTKVASFTKEHIKPALLVDAANSKKYSFILS